MKIVVIGAGAAGLTAAAYLSKAGHQVTVCDHNSEPGGVLMGWQKDGYQWDLGQLLIEGLGSQEPIGAILSELGIFDLVPTVKDDRRYVFPDFSIDKPEEYQGFDWRMRYLQSIFPEDATGLERYWQDYQRFTRLMTIGRALGKAKGMRGWWLKLRLLSALFPFLTRQQWSAQQLMEAYFTSERLQAVFISILADFFTPPSQFMGLGVFALNPEPSFDARMPKELAPGSEQIYYYSIVGGTRTLVDAFVSCIQNHGGTMRLNTDIDHILLKDGRVSGVLTGAAEHIECDLVIASGGAKETFFKLLNKKQLPESLATQVEELPLMDSVFMVHLGLDQDPAPQMGGVCTYYYGTYDVEGGILENKNHVYHEGRLGFVAHAPTLRSPQMAPDGLFGMTIYTICPDTLAEGDWESRKAYFADRLIHFASQHLPELGEHIVKREILTPPDFRSITHTDHHAFGGLAPLINSRGIAHKTAIPGLWFIGQQSEGGGGLNNVITHAYQAAREAIS